MSTEIEAVVTGLESAWNRADGAAFAGYFEEDADFVNINGMHSQGRQKIAEGHEMILRTIYAGSTVRYTVSQVRLLREDVALVHINAVMNAPHGPLAGENHALPSAVMLRGPNGWRIASFHNTLVKAPPGMRP